MIHFLVILLYILGIWITIFILADPGEEDGIDLFVAATLWPALVFGLTAIAPFFIAYKMGKLLKIQLKRKKND